MSNLEDKKDFCQEYVNKLPQEGREEIFDILRLYVDDMYIDSSNSDGSRVYCSHITDEAFEKLYRAIRGWLEN
jgi:hypothetical protein